MAASELTDLSRCAIHTLTNKPWSLAECIDIRQIRGWVEQAGFRGFNEVEIFSEDYWAMDQVAQVDAIKQAYQHCS